MHELADISLPTTYRPEVLSTLARLGAAPTPTTQPRLVYSFLRALMTFEIRDRKARRRELERFFGPQPLADYQGEIEALRAKYHLLRQPLSDWVTGARR